MEDPATLQDLRNRIALLEDREEIRDLIERYAEAADRANDPALMSDLFADHAIWEASGFGRFEGRSAILDGLHEIGSKRLIWTMHYMISPRIRIAADRATAEASWRVWELATMQGKNQPEAVWGGGTYRVDLARRDGKWHFNHLRLTLNLISRYNEGWAATRLAEI